MAVVWALRSRVALLNMPYLGIMESDTNLKYLQLVTSKPRLQISTCQWPKIIQCPGTDINTLSHEGLYYGYIEHPGKWDLLNLQLM
jgi:hypothetical protein